MSRRAFTLLELLIFAAVFTIAMAVFIAMFISVVGVQSRQASMASVQSEGQYLMQQIQYYTQTARLVDMPIDTATGTLEVRPTTIGTNDPTYIYASGTIVYVQLGGASHSGSGTSPLTSSKVTVSNLTFTRHVNGASTSTPYQSDSISYSFTMSANNSNATMQYTQNFQSAVVVLAPVEKIILLQDAAAKIDGPTITAITTTYPGNTSQNSLLFAVLGAAQFPNPATATIADTLGNSWTSLGMVSTTKNNYAAMAFYAVNASSGTDVVSSSFASTTQPSLFIAEYRGITTSSPLDTFATSGQQVTAAPSLTVPSSVSSTTELVLAVVTASTTAPWTAPTAGAGCTLLDAETISETAVEDCSNVYVSGPVQTTFNFSGSLTSVMMMGLFK